MRVFLEPWTTTHATTDTTKDWQDGLWDGTRKQVPDVACSGVEAERALKPPLTSLNIGLMIDWTGCCEHHFNQRFDTSVGVEQGYSESNWNQRMIRQLALLWVSFL